MGERERAKQPSPDRALMVSGVSLTGSAATFAFVARFARSQAAQAMRGEQLLCEDVYDCLSLYRGKWTCRERNGKDLIWAQRTVFSTQRCVDDVITTLLFGIPEFLE